MEHKSVYVGQHVVFTDVALGTAGYWRLYASSPSLQAGFERVIKVFQAVQFSYDLIH